MKKNLIILGLLVCTTGIAFADEVTTANNEPIVTQQVEVQNQIDKETFQNIEQNRKFNKEINQGFKNKSQDKIKLDKSVNNKKFKNGENWGNDKYNSKKHSIFSKGYKNPKFTKDKQEPKFNKKTPIKYSHKRPQRHMDFKNVHRPHRNMYARHSHHPRMNRYHRPSRNI